MRILLIIAILAFSFSSKSFSFTHDKIIKDLNKAAEELNKQNNSQKPNSQPKQQAQPKQQQAQPKQQQAQPKQQQTQQAQPSPSKDLTIKETNFVNRNHQEAVEYFNSMRAEIDKNRAKIESLGGLSGKQIYCKGRGNDRFGFYFVGGNALLYRFVPDPERNAMIDVGSRNVIHPALEIGKIQYYEDKEKNEINLEIEKINRETLDFYQVVNPFSGYNYKKVGKCEIAEGDLYIQFKKLSDNYVMIKKKQDSEQLKKNKL